jgi:hypothetical protein
MTLTVKAGRNCFHAWLTSFLTGDQAVTSICRLYVACVCNASCKILAACVYRRLADTVRSTRASKQSNTWKAYIPDLSQSKGDVPLGVAPGFAARPLRAPQADAVQFASEMCTRLWRDHFGS